MTSHDQTTKMDDSIQDIGFEASFSSSTDDCESEYIVYLFEGDEKSMKSSQSLSLTLVGSSISVAVESELRPIIAGKVPRSGLHSGTGHMCNLRDDDKPHACFLCLLDVPKEVRRSGKQILIVLLCTGRPSLELFRSELERYCKELVEPFTDIMSKGHIIEDFNGSQASHLLSQWYRINTLYIDRCTDFCKAFLPHLLSMSILTDFEVTGNDRDAVRDIEMLLNASSLASLVQCSGSNEVEGAEVGEAEDPLPPDGSLQVSNPLVISGTYGSKSVTVTLTCSGMDLSQRNPQPFCLEWAKIVASKEDPFLKRQSVENYKLKLTFLQHLCTHGSNTKVLQKSELSRKTKMKVIQDVNTLKRLLQQAEADYRSLYRAFLFLCHSGNGEALLLIAALEAATVGSKSAQAVPVVQALKEYTFKNGFEHARQKASNCVAS